MANGRRRPPPQREGDDERDDVDARCQKMLARLREECPHLIPPVPLEAGTLAPPVPLKTKPVEQLIRAAISGREKEEAVVLVDGDSELLLHIAGTRVAIADGLVLIGLSVECDQTGEVEVVIPFAVGTPSRPAGMVVTTEPVPRGPEVIVGRWGQALQAVAWNALLEAATGIGRHAGTDTDSAPLLPGALLAEKGVLHVVPQARHGFDRQRDRERERRP